MAPDKNLLEAFRSAGGPAVTPAPEPAAPAPPPPGEGEERRGRFAGGTPPWLPVALAAGAAFLVGVVVGRASVGSPEVAAAEGESAGSSELRFTGAAAPVRAGAGEDDPGESDPNAPLFDPANQYTLVVATYDAGRKDYADAAYFELLDAGLGVFHPYAKGNHWLVLVGASPTVEGLEAAKRRVQTLRGGTYADAYAQRIDKLISR